MDRLVIAALAGAAGVIAWDLSRSASHGPGAPRQGWLARHMLGHMQSILASMPEDAPPKLVMTILPKLQAQNETIIALLREQNELLRGRRTAP
ncbi:hypothetical protein ABEG18_00395 [Alsobacter sp. KACC 23698]|uniref:Uncharacterized protein n=1 Tax=Alsobacter sp. KACC 23698 TaxID=3149229 RepID=A0AAU7JFV7_9HYPH